MKKALMILGGISLVLVVAIVAVFSIIAVKGNALDKECKAYVDNVTPIILANLNQETLFQFASDEFKNSSSDEEFAKIFKWFEKLGKFKTHQDSSGSSNIFISPANGKQITGKYTIETAFENGPATVTISTIKKDNGWQIIGFHINSMALMNE